MPIITGGNSDDDLPGTAGDDTITGLGGDDTLTGGLGNDSLDGGSGQDTASYAGATSGVTVDLTQTGPQDTLGAGTDTLTSIEWVTGSDHDDTLTSAADSDDLSLIRGGAGNDTLRAAPSTTVPVILDGGAGNDTIDANGVTGLSPPVAAAYLDATSGVTVDLSLGSTPQDTIGAGIDTLIGIHNVVGSPFDDHLVGSAQADMFEVDISQAGPSGNDTIDGGGGGDWLNYALASGGVTVSLAIAGAQATGSGTETISNIANISGSDYADTLTGDGAANSLLGKSGDDTLIGGAGADALDGGADQDVASYAGAASGVTVNLTVSSPQDTIGAGIDTLTNIESVTGSDHDDTLTAASVPGGVSIVLGGAGNDVVRAAASTAGSVILNGGAGNDTIDASAAPSFAFQVIAAYGDAAGGVTVNLGLNGVAQDTVGAGVDTLIGVHNVLGSHFDDHLTGSAQADMFEADLSGFGASGNDTIDGGGGSDWLNYSGSAGGVTLSLALTWAQSIGGGTETISNIANVVGSAFDDTLTGAVGANILNGNVGNDTLNGGAGNDILNGGAGQDMASYAGSASGVTVNLTLGAAQNTGGAGTDTLSQIESVTGSGFDDTLTSSSGAGGFSVVDGGAGNDTLHAAASAAGTIILLGGAGNDTIDANGNTSLFPLVIAAYGDASNGVNVNLGLSGVAQDTGNGTDTLIGVHNVSGSRFDDHLVGSAQADMFELDLSGSGASGNDTVDGGGGVDWLSFAFAGAGATVNLSLSGAQSTGSGTETISNITNILGSGFDDLLTGNGAANGLLGSGGNDTLNGGSGNDTLNGGSGNDTFGFAPGDGADHIADFAAGGTDDSIDLSTYAHIGSFEQVLARAVQVGSDTVIELGDEDNVTLSNVSRSGLTASDFILPVAVSADLGSGADFNGDGLADTLWRNNSGTVALWLSHAGSSAVTYAGLDTVSSAWHIQGSGDFDGDGRADILWRHDSGFTALWLSTPSGRPSYVGVGQVGLNWHVQAVADFNGDGKADVLWRDDNGLTAEWRSNPSNSDLTYVGLDQVNLNWHVQATADFNGDGLADILWRDDNGLVAEWLSQPGSTQVSYVGLNTVPMDWHILGAGDFNGDGKADILWRNDSGLVGLWQSIPGSSELPYVGLANVPLSWHMQAIGDFNNDGKADVLWRDDTGRTALWDSTPGGAISYQDLGVVGASWFIS